MQDNVFPNEGGIQMADIDKREQPASKGPSPITTFAIKTAIVAAACVLSIVAIASYIDGIIEDRIDQITLTARELAPNLAPSKVGGRAFWTRLENELHDQADPRHGMPPEQRKRILADIRVLSDRWRPFIAEAFGQRADSTDQAPANPSPR
jgi:hypothetical protein